MFVFNVKIKIPKLYKQPFPKIKKWKKWNASIVMKRCTKKESYKVAIQGMKCIAAMNVGMKRWKLLELIQVIIGESRINLKNQNGQYGNGHALRPMLSRAVN